MKVRIIDKAGIDYMRADGTKHICPYRWVGNIPGGVAKKGIKSGQVEEYTDDEVKSAAEADEQPPGEQGDKAPSKTVAAQPDDDLLKRLTSAEAELVTTRASSQILAGERNILKLVVMKAGADTGAVEALIAAPEDTGLFDLVMASLEKEPPQEVVATEAAQSTDVLDDAGSAQRDDLFKKYKLFSKKDLQGQLDAVEIEWNEKIPRDDLAMLLATEHAK
jgi:hypothetical protein